MGRIARISTTLVAAPAFLALTAGPAVAYECINASKPANAGVRVLVSFHPVTSEESLLFQNEGLARQFERDPEGTEERFRGILGFDFDGDGEADLSTYIVGPDGEIPLPAQERGAECKGIVTFDDYMTCAL